MALGCVASACIAEVIQQSVDSVVGLASLDAFCCGIELACEVTVVLDALADSDSLTESGNIVTAAQHSVDSGSEVLGVLLQFCCILVVCYLIVGCIHENLQAVLHCLGEVLVSCCESDGILHQLYASVVVNFLYVDTAVIEATAPVLVYLGSNHVLSCTENLCRDVYLYRILAVSPTGILLEEHAVDVCLVVVVMANIECIAQARIDFVECEGTANPVTCVVRSVSIHVCVVVDTCRPLGLNLRHVVEITYWHCSVIPFRVIELRHCPCQSLGTAVDNRVFHMLAVTAEVHEIEVMSAYPQFFSGGLVHKRHVAKLHVCVGRNPCKVEHNLEVGNISACECNRIIIRFVSRNLNILFVENYLVVVHLAQFHCHGVVLRR